MNTIFELVAVPLRTLLSLCIDLCSNYVIAIVIFTLFTKVILFPVSLWVQKNSIKLVQLTPELNQLKLKYYGDKDTIAEETQALYKRVKYHPLVSTFPMFIQLILLVGVIGAVRGMLEGETGTMLVQIPAEVGGAALLMPVAAGGAALLLGLAQNHLNPLQREQGKAEQWMTNGFSIAISLLLGAFVPLGVGIYWICSNLFTILQQMILNTVIPPKKYIDYETLKKSREELSKISSLGGKRSKEEKHREKADYKRFFSIANKHLVFYSERSGFYKYFENVIDYLLSHSNVTIHYITSDPKDAIFHRAAEQPRIKPYYIGERKLITLMMKMDADMVVMTMPDLENYHIKRSYVKKDVEYVFMFHGPLSMHMAMRNGCVDHFDTIFSVGPHTTAEVQRIEEIYHLPAKTIVECGYGLLENLRTEYLQYNQQAAEHKNRKILIAPSWQPGNIMEGAIKPMLDSLKDTPWEICVRPHPQYVRHFLVQIHDLEKQYSGYPNILFQTDFSSNRTIFEADILISDWSGIAYEFAFATQKPVLFINTPMKVMNPEYTKLGMEPLEITLRNQVGISIDLDNLDQSKEIVQSLLAKESEYSDHIGMLREKYFYHFGHSGEMGAKYILRELTNKKEDR